MAGYTYVPYKESDIVANARNNSNTVNDNLSKFYNQGYYVGAGGYGNQISGVNQNIANLNKNAPSLNYSYGKQKKLNKAMNNIVNRDAFSYDMDNDVLFQQAKNQFQALGKTAMDDTMGQASALTGGYGNSYATTAGAQAYSNYLQQLNNSVGDYYAMALSTYNTETDRLNNAYNTLATDKANDFNEWQGEQSVYNNLLSLYTGQLSDLQGLDQSAWQNKGDGLATIAGLYADNYNTESGNDLSKWSTGENLKAEQSSQALEEAKFEETKKQNAFNNKMTKKEYKLAKKQANDNRKDKYKATSTPVTSEIIKEIDDTAQNKGFVGKAHSNNLKILRKNSIKEALKSKRIGKEEANYLCDYYDIDSL